MNPLFTIAVPTFNRADWLGRSVGSALAQTHASFEVLVSDNASEDATPQVLAHLSDRRLVTIRQPRNIGPLANWNSCVARARGQFIVMLSDDDYLAPYFLSRCAGLLVNSTNRIRIIVALGDAVNLDTGWRNPARRSRVLQTGIQRGTEVLSEFLLDAITPQMCTVAIATESLRDSGGFPAGWHHFDDLAAWLPLLFEGDVGFVNESCGIQAAHSSSQTAGMALDTRLEEIDRLGGVLLAAGSTIGDRATAARIARLTQRYVARNLVGHIGAERRNGGSRRAVASKAWRWRHRLVELRPADLRVTLRPIALLVAPLWFAGAMATVKRRFTKRGRHSAVRRGSSVASGMRS